MAQSYYVSSNPFQQAVWKPKTKVVAEDFDLDVLSEVAFSQVKEEEKKKEEKKILTTIFPGGKIFCAGSDEGYEVASVSDEADELKIVLKKKDKRKISSEEIWWSTQNCQGCAGGCLGCEVWRPTKVLLV